MTLPERVWTRINFSWGIFFVVLGFANLYVAFYYAPHLSDEAREAIWVNFKLFGMMGLTLLFVVGQAFYIARHASFDQSGTEKPEEEQE